MGENHQSILKKSTILKTIGKWVLGIVIILLLLLLSLNLTPVQNFIANRVTSSLSKKLEADVSLEHINISITKGLVLKGFSIVEVQDTIVSCKELNISLRKSLLNLFSKQLFVENIKLKGSKIYLLTTAGDEISNIEKLLAKLASDKQSNDKSSPILFQLSSLNIEDVDLTVEHQDKGIIQQFKLNNSLFEIEELDFKHKNYVFKDVDLHRPEIYFTRNGDDYTKAIEGVEPFLPMDSLGFNVNLIIYNLNISDGKFYYENDLNCENVENGFDSNHFQFSDFNLSLEDIIYAESDSLKGRINKFNFKEAKGFEMNNIKLGDFLLNDRGLSLEDLYIETNNSKFQTTAKLKFKSQNDLKTFNENVFADIFFGQSELALADLAYFIPSLQTKPFFINNQALKVNLSGIINGRPNNFSGREVEMSLGNKFKLDGNFSARNINKSELTLLHLNISQLKTSIQFLRVLIPNFNPPENFNKLEDFVFSGKFDGFLKDFVAYGKLNTGIGSATMDMRLDVKSGVEKAFYSGEISLKDFDIGKWSDIKDLGKINFISNVSEGKGLTGATAEADLIAKINSLEYKNYLYKDFILDGNIKNNSFNGSFSVNDENLDFIFDGKVDLSNELPVFDFKTNINQIDLQALNLIDYSFLIDGAFNINSTGSNIDNIVGDFYGSDINIVRKDSLYHFDTLAITSKNIGNGQKTLDLFSDFGKVKVEGNYILSNFGNSLKKIFEVNYKYPAELLKIHAKEISEPESYTFDISISNSKNLFNLVGISGLSLLNFKAKGGLNTVNDELDFAVSTPEIRIKENKFFDVQILANSADSKGDILINIDSTFLMNRGFNPIDIQARLNKDTANIKISTYNLADSIERFDVLTNVIPHKDGYEVHLKDEELIILGKKWKINPDNKIVIAKNYHKIENLVLTDSERYVEISDLNSKGINFRLRDFDFISVNSLINYDKMDFSGVGNLSLKLDDIYNNNTEISGQMHINDFLINGDSYGVLELDVTRPKGKPLDALFSLTKGNQFIKADAKYNLDEKSIVSTVKAKNFPLRIFEYILYKGISDTKGLINMDAEVNGNIDDLQINGGGYVNDGSLKIIYLGTKYYFDKQPVKLTENKIDLTGAIIYDEEGNPGTIIGGLLHNAFRDFRVDANLSGNNVLALKTTKFENPIYYGKGKGNISVDFLGPFDQVDIKIKAIAGAGSEISIPIKETQLGVDESFIKFITKEDLINTRENPIKEEFKIEGLSIEMNLTLTEDVKVNLIFDEEKGDIISGTGRGNMKVVINRNGDFEMFGEYEIERGQYLFTALGLVNKFFQVRRGGKVVWTGDPINARLDIKADYTTRSSLINFIPEYIISEQLANAARGNQEVNLILNLGGTLYSPDIQFDMEFPDLTGGELKSLVENKILLLKNSPNELNNQVFGLLVINSFLPTSTLSSSLGSNNFLQTAGISTLSEFLSNQLSGFVTSFINQALEENGLISDIDFDISVRNNNNPFGITASGTSIAPSEIEVRLKNRFRFLDERLEFHVGGNYVRESVLQNQNYIVPDFAIQYYLTEDRKLKVKMYGKYDFDLVETQSRNQKYGLGIGYRTEFGSLYQMKDIIKERVVPK